MKTVIFSNNVIRAEGVYGPFQKEQLAELFSCDGNIYTKEDLPKLVDVEYIFSTCGGQ